MNYKYKIRVVFRLILAANLSTIILIHDRLSVTGTITSSIIFVTSVRISTHLKSFVQGGIALTFTMLGATSVAKTYKTTVFNVGLI